MVQCYRAFQHFRSTGTKDYIKHIVSNFQKHSLLQNCVFQGFSDERLLMVCEICAFIWVLSLRGKRQLGLQIVNVGTYCNVITGLCSFPVHFIDFRLKYSTLVTRTSTDYGTILYWAKPSPLRVNKYWIRRTCVTLRLT